MSEFPPHEDADELDRAERLWSDGMEPDLEDLRAVQRQLDEEGDRYREEFVAETMDGGPVPGEERAIAALEHAMAQVAEATPIRTFRRQAVWLAAVAAGLLIVAALRLGVGPADSPARDAHTQQPKAPLILSGRANDFLLQPIGEVTTLETFRWREAPGRGAIHEVCVWFGSAPSGAPDMTEEVYDDPQWQPSPDQLKTLNAHGPDIYWEVVEIDPVDQTRAVLGSGSASLQR